MDRKKVNKEAQSGSRALQNSADILGVFDDIGSQDSQLMSMDLEFAESELEGLVDLNSNDSDGHPLPSTSGNSWNNGRKRKATDNDLFVSPARSALDSNTENEGPSNASEEEEEDSSENEIMIIDNDDSTGSQPTMTKASGKGVGRKKKPIWRYYNQTKNSSGKVVVTCKKCENEVSARPDRMKNHLTTCRKVMEESRKKQDVTARSSPGLPRSSTTIFKTPSKTERQESIKKWAEKQDVQLSSRMDAKIAKFFFACNIPFRTADSKYFKDIYDEPAYRNYDPPSAKRLKTTLLDKQYAECNGSLKTLLQGKKAVIVQDGWSTTQNDPVISHCLQAGDTPVFFDAIATEDNKKTAHYCFQLLEQAIEKATIEYGCKVVGVVTDNCNAMKLLRKLVGEKYPELFVYGCNAHIFNLLGQDLTDDTVISKVVKVQTYFRNHHFEASALKKVGGRKPALPNHTRWNSQLDTLRSFKENHLKYMEVLRMPDCKANRDIRSVVEDTRIYSEVVQLLEVLQPIAIRLDESQGDSCTLADTYKKWQTLKEELVLDERGRRAFESRMELACPPVAIAAYMLHPLYRGENVSREEQDKAFDFLSDKSPMLVAIVASLRAGDTNMFPRRLLDETTIRCMSASAWWKSLGSFTSIPGTLIDYCESLMLLTSSTACIERSFSTLGNIITKKRNRLAVEKAKKLCVVYKTLAMSDNNVEEESEEDD